mmetsp:Transcript_19884/g.43029  ORF Transcript_19884/g.43029 Transcript_19884/m.43029 type:complete len:232 (+) Transcript_19884:185-880(+)
MSPHVVRPLQPGRPPVPPTFQQSARDWRVGGGRHERKVWSWCRRRRRRPSLHTSMTQTIHPPTSPLPSAGARRCRGSRRCRGRARPRGEGTGAAQCWAATDPVGQGTAPHHSHSAHSAAATARCCVPAAGVPAATAPVVTTGPRAVTSEVQAVGTRCAAGTAAVAPVVLWGGTVGREAATECTRSARCRWQRWERVGQRGGGELGEGARWERIPWQTPARRSSGSGGNGRH